MITIPRMAKVLRKVFESDARDLARSMGVIQRERKLNGTRLALILVLGWLHHPQACGAEEQEYEVDLGAAKQVTCRVVARRASEDQVKRRHKKQDEYARKHGTQVSQRQRDWVP